MLSGILINKPDILINNKMLSPYQLRTLVNGTVCDCWYKFVNNGESWTETCGYILKKGNNAWPPEAALRDLRAEPLTYLSNWTEPPLLD